MIRFSDVPVFFWFLLVALFFGLSIDCTASDVKTLHADSTGLVVLIRNTEMFGAEYYETCTALSYDSEHWYITKRSSPSIVLPKNRYVCIVSDLSEKRLINCKK